MTPRAPFFPLLATALSLSLALCATACSSSTQDHATGGSNGGSAGSGAGGSGGSAGSGAGAGAGGSATSGSGGAGASGGAGGGVIGSSTPCDDDTKGNIYLLGIDHQIARFNPNTNAVTLIGTPDCPGEDKFSFVYSMAVDRYGVAWVLYSETIGLYRVDLKTLACEKTGFQPCDKNFCRFGMGFVSDGPGSDQETLFVSGNGNASPGVGLARIDTKTFAITPVANYDVSLGSAAELTGTGDGRLFAFFEGAAGSPGHVAEIEKTTAHVLSSVTLDNVTAAGSFAFAAWGSAFYIMTDNVIHRYDPATKTATIANKNVGFDVLGAGVSTCAPSTLP
jgi:hypothetical protein